MLTQILHRCRFKWKKKNINILMQYVKIWDFEWFWFCITVITRLIINKYCDYIIKYKSDYIFFFWIYFKTGRNIYLDIINNWEILASLFSYEDCLFSDSERDEICLKCFLIFHLGTRFFYQKAYCYSHLLGRFSIAYNFRSWRSFFKIYCTCFS